MFTTYITGHQSITRGIYDSLPPAFLLFIAGLFLLFSLKSQNLTRDLKTSASIVVELESGYDKTSEIIEFLDSQSLVRKGSVHHISKDQAYNLMLDEIPQLADWQDMNPFRDVITFQLNGVDEPMRNSESFFHRLETRSGVSQVYIPKSPSDETITLLKRISYIAIGLNLILIIGITYIMYHMVHGQLNHYKHRIRLLEKVGATRNFIRKPFLLNITQRMTLSAAIATLMLTLAVWYFNESWSGLFMISAGELLVGIFFLIILGLSISVIGTYIIVNLYLSKIFQSDY